METTERQPPLTPLQGFVETAKKKIWSMIARVKEMPVCEPVNAAPNAGVAATLNATDDVKMSCYTPSCVIAGKCQNCYAPTALLTPPADSNDATPPADTALVPTSQYGSQFESDGIFLVV